MWDATTFTKNRDRLLARDVAVKFLIGVLAQPQVKALLSGEHFSVDGTLLEAWASTKSFRPKDGSGPPARPGRNGEQDFRGRKRSNETHASTTEPDARLYRKGGGKEAKLRFMGHALMENRNGLIVGAVATRASGRAERLAAVELITPHAERPGRPRLQSRPAAKAAESPGVTAGLRPERSQGAKTFGETTEILPRRQHMTPHQRQMPEQPSTISAAC